MSGAQIVYVVVGGFGGSKKAYRAFCKWLSRVTKAKVFFIESLREGQPDTEYQHDSAVSPLALQAAHLADEVKRLKRSGEISEKAEIHVVAHSMGGPEGLVLAARHGRELRVTSVILLCSACFYPEWIGWLAFKIGWMMVRGIATSREGQNYWLHSGPYFFPFRRLWRSLQEAWCVSRQAVTPQLLDELVDQGIDVWVGLSRGDGVFSHEKVVRILRRLPRVKRFDVSEKTGHNPQFDLDALGEAFAEAGLIPS